MAPRFRRGLLFWFVLERFRPTSGFPNLQFNFTQLKKKLLQNAGSEAFYLFVDGAFRW